MRTLLAILVLSATAVFVSGCGSDCGTDTCYYEPAPRTPVVYSPPPSAPVVRPTSTTVALPPVPPPTTYCNPCAGI